MTVFIIMRGFPGSGKSTRASEIASKDGSTMVVSYDAIRVMLGLSQKRWHECFNPIDDVEKKFIIDTASMLAARAIRQGFNVVFDAQNIRNGDVRELYYLAINNGADTVRTEDIPMSLDKLLYRNRNRPEPDRLDDAYIISQYERFNSTAFKPLEEIINNSETNNKKKADYMTGESNLLESMRKNDNVHVKLVKGEDNLYACNFTRKAFGNHDWDEYSSRARGLFLNGDGDVIMRGFDKFFNIDENEETSYDNVLKRVTYPARVETKQNGFLGIVGARDNVSDFRFFSKSGLTDYSDMVENGFRTAFNNDEDVLKTAWSILHDNNVTLVCEVVDEDSDRHIIDYDGSCCYLIHTIDNQEKFHINAKADKELHDFVHSHNLPARMTIDSSIIVNNPEELADAINNARNSEREGVVIYSADGYMCKVKSKHYLDTKSLRYILKRVLLKGDAVPSDNSPRAERARWVLEHADRSRLVYTRELFNQRDVDMSYVGELLLEKNK